MHIWCKFCHTCSICSGCHPAVHCLGAGPTRWDGRCAWERVQGGTAETCGNGTINNWQPSVVRMVTIPIGLISRDEESMIMRENMGVPTPFQSDQACKKIHKRPASAGTMCTFSSRGDYKAWWTHLWEWAVGGSTASHPDGAFVWYRNYKFYVCSKK